MKTKYVVVQRPESQILMEQPWFVGECSLIDPDIFGDAAYLVPEKRYNEMKGVYEIRSYLPSIIQISREEVDNIKEGLKNDAIATLKEMLPEVTCNNCDWEGKENELIQGKDEEGYFNGCPNCETDSFLMDLDNSDLEERVNIQYDLNCKTIITFK